MNERIIIEGKMKKLITIAYSKAKSIVYNVRFNRRYQRGLTVARECCQNHKIPPLTPHDIKEIDDYWGKYGIKFRDYSFHQMYYHVTGNKDPRFIPDTLAGNVIYPYYNDLVKAESYADKNLFSKILPNAIFPRMIAQRINNYYYDSEHRYYGVILSDSFVGTVFQELNQLQVSEIIIKNSINTYSGKGVKKYTINSYESLKRVLNEYNSSDFIVQECIKQHDFFKQFNPDSVNIIRLTTWRTGSDIKVFSPCLRFGIPGSATDITYIDGKEIISGVGIKNGLIADYYYTLDGEKKQMLVDNRTVPKWKEIVNFVKTSHMELDYFGVVGWDVTISEADEIICIEYNLKWPGTIVYQFCHGPFAGDETENYLKFLENSFLQKALLPKYIRL